MPKPRLIQLICLAVIVSCAAGSTWISTWISKSASNARLSYTERVEDNAPPQVGLGIAMGAFRGRFVNMRWSRANNLKEEGRFHEAMELSSAITTLQPRFPRVWVFQAWNMAYNISVATQTPDERWQWVQAGIRLLRDEGIPANPNDLLIHRELAWIYLHKIGGWTDDANRYYKRRLAEEWHTGLGPPPPPPPELRDREDAIEAYATWLEQIANAPESLNTLLEREPTVGELLARLEVAIGGETDMQLLRRYVVHSAMEGSVYREMMMDRFSENSRAFQELIETPSLADAWDAYIAFVRKAVLMREYKMDPARMVIYTRKFGPMDWRHPASHAVYWSSSGVEASRSRVTADNKKDFDWVNTDRLAIQSVQDLYRSGELYFDYLGYVLNGSDFYAALPNPHFVATYGNVLEELRSRSRFDQDNRIWTMYSAGYENFLKDAVRFFYRRGQRDRAEHYQSVLINYDQQNFNDPDRAEKFGKPLDEFVQDQFKEDRAFSPHVASTEITAALQGAYLAGLVTGDVELFRKQFDYARRFHRYYLDEQGRISIQDVQGGPKVVFPRDFRFMAGRVFADIISLLDVADAEVAYFTAPNHLRQFAYDILGARFRETLAVSGEAGGREFDAVFPEPEGMDEFRQYVQRAAAEAATEQPAIQRR